MHPVPGARRRVLGRPLVRQEPRTVQRRWVVGAKGGYHRHLHRVLHRPRVVPRELRVRLQAPGPHVRRLRRQLLLYRWLLHRVLRLRCQELHRDPHPHHHRCLPVGAAQHARRREVFLARHRPRVPPDLPAHWLLLHPLACRARRMACDHQLCAIQHRLRAASVHWRLEQDHRVRAPAPSQPHRWRRVYYDVPLQQVPRHHHLPLVPPEPRVEEVPLPPSRDQEAAREQLRCARGFLLRLPRGGAYINKTRIPCIPPHPYRSVLSTPSLTLNPNSQPRA
mmetsp:Transcript_26342/g.84390  ORF Transcript_26342/g.84390 Transcript_26342/m.84390 type:complete len:279 (-) Transcript_26342:57-893(-)